MSLPGDEHFGKPIEAEHSGGYGFSVIPEGMDTFSCVLITITVISAVYQVIYMVAPRALQALLEYYDYDESLDKGGDAEP